MFEKTKTKGQILAHTHILFPILVSELLQMLIKLLNTRQNNHQRAQQCDPADALTTFSS